jgi:hypothetical protein
MNPLELMPMPIDATWRAIETIVGDCCEILLATDPGGYMCHVTADAGRLIAHSQSCPSPSHAILECMITAIAWKTGKTVYIGYREGDEPE